MSVRLLTAWLRSCLNLPRKSIAQDLRHFEVHPQASGHDHISSQAAGTIETNAIGRQCQCEVGTDPSDLCEPVNQPYGNAIRVCRVHRVPFVQGFFGLVGQGNSSCQYELAALSQAQSNTPIDPDALRNVYAAGEAR